MISIGCFGRGRYFFQMPTLPRWLQTIHATPWKSSLRVILLGCTLPILSTASTEIESNGIIWSLDKAPSESGTFLTGDPWVVGPVKVIGIRNKLNDSKFSPRPGQNGSMLNPGGTSKQGYDDGLASYDESLNAGLPMGKPVAPNNPLELKPGSSLVSMVSWLYNSSEDREPGCPKFGGGAQAPRPATRSAGILTVLDKAPAAGSFRPPYCGEDKTVKFNVSQLDYSKLPKLKPVASAPSYETMAGAMARPWVDHVNAWLGAHIHPSEHMPNYGRDLARIVATCILASYLSDDPPGKNPDRDKVIQNLVQFGIDLTGIADVGGGWPADGGHALGRKMPILYAGVLLDDPHMKNAGHWQTRFQENEQTFYVTQAEVDITNSSQWAPDERAATAPYTEKDIGMAEWGIRHAKEPHKDNNTWEATYREINGAIFPAFALAAQLMNLKEAWNHNAFFDYADRYMEWFSSSEKTIANQPSEFFQEMWATYRQNSHL
jgi:hypothetical protein